MLRYGFAVFLVGIMAVAASHTRTSAADDPVTFSKHVLPILQKNCQSCHRPGAAGPLSSDFDFGPVTLFTATDFSASSAGFDTLAAGATAGVLQVGYAVDPTAPIGTGAISFGWPAPGGELGQLGPAPYRFDATVWVDGQKITLGPRTWPDDWQAGDQRSRPAAATP